MRKINCIFEVLFPFLKLYIAEGKYGKPSLKGNDVQVWQSVTFLPLLV
jgi:hypothetical protein